MNFNLVALEPNPLKADDCKVQSQQRFDFESSMGVDRPLCFHTQKTSNEPQKATGADSWGESPLAQREQRVMLLWASSPCPSPLPMARRFVLFFLTSCHT